MSTHSLIPQPSTRTASLVAAHSVSGHDAPEAIAAPFQGIQAPAFIPNPGSSTAGTLVIPVDGQSHAVLTNLPTEYVPRHIVENRPPNWTPQELDRELDNLDQLATLLDTKWRIPLWKRWNGGRKYLRVGVDTLFEAVPVVGPMAALGVSVYIVGKGAHLGIRGRRRALMVWNAVFDWFLGSVPLIGIVLNSLFKANKRNVNHILKHYGRPLRDVRAVAEVDVDVLGVNTAGTGTGAPAASASAASATAVTTQQQQQQPQRGGSAITSLSSLLGVPVPVPVARMVAPPPAEVPLAAASTGPLPVTGPEAGPVGGAGAPVRVV